MDQSRILFVGLDVHKDKIDIAPAEASHDAPVRHLATVAGGSVAVTKALRRLHPAPPRSPSGFFSFVTIRVRGESGPSS